MSKYSPQHLVLKASTGIKTNANNTYEKCDQIDYKNRYVHVNLNNKEMSADLEYDGADFKNITPGRDPKPHFLGK
jgi:hypothetical protein